MKNKVAIWLWLSFVALPMNGLPGAEQGTAPQENKPPEGHSIHGEAFNEGPRQGAYLMSGTGKVNFCQSAESPFGDGSCAAVDSWG